MALYALGISPLVQKLGENFDPDDLIQCWFADDSSSAGKLLHLREWWDNLCSNGPQYGYYPLAKKTVLIVKPEYKDVAEEISEIARLPSLYQESVTWVQLSEATNTS